MISEEDCLNPKNRIIAENCLKGNDSRTWDINGDGDPSIQGFADEFSLLPGQTVNFKVKTDSKDYRFDIFRVGYYNGDGARHIDTVLPSVQLPQNQPPCMYEEDTMNTDCGNWNISGSWNIPDDQITGVYFARVIRHDGERSWRADNS